MNQGLIRNNEFLQIFPHSFQVVGHPRTVDNDNLVTGYTVKVDLPGPIFPGRMKLDLVEGPCGLVAQVDITVRCPPFGRYVVFHLAEKEKQTRLCHEVLVGLVRQLGQMIRPAQSTTSKGPIQIGAELP